MRSAAVLVGGGAVPVSLIGFVTAILVPALFMRVGDGSRDNASDRWDAVAALSPLLACLSAAFVHPAWYVHATARPVAAVVTADHRGGADGPGYQLIRVKAVDTGEDLGELWFRSDRNLTVRDHVVVHVDRIGWAPTSDGSDDQGITTMGYILGAAALTGFAVVLTSQVRADRMDFRRRELRRDGKQEPYETR